ncbi:Multiple epidermal growth factor-like domains protein 8 [Terramyces sp. JEL0728]|nr:Multiple epidermal growth factor-like domains protein 8 [Terramyces sp. JEL0728]
MFILLPFAYFECYLAITYCPAYTAITDKPNGYIFSQIGSSYQNNAQCKWHITASDPGAVIKLSFLYFDTECGYDYVYISNDYAQTTSIAQLCGNRFASGNMVNTFISDIAYLTFGSDWNSISPVKSDFLSYNFATNNWTEINTNIPPPRMDHYSWVYNSKLYLFGGYTNYDIYHDLWEYDSSTNRWKQLTATTFPQNLQYNLESAVVFVPRTSGFELYVYSGIDGRYYSPAYSLFKYDSAANTWIRLRDGPVGLEGGKAVYSLETNSIRIISGYPVNDQYYNNDVLYTFEYSIDSDIWLVLAPRNIDKMRYQSSVDYLGDNYAFVYGGMLPASADACFESNVQILDLVHRKGQATIFRNGTLYIFGGNDGLLHNDVVQVELATGANTQNRDLCRVDNYCSNFYTCEKCSATSYCSWCPGYCGYNIFDYPLPTVNSSSYLPNSNIICSAGNSEICRRVNLTLNSIYSSTISYGSYLDFYYSTNNDYETDSYQLQLLNTNSNANLRITVLEILPYTPTTLSGILFVANPAPDQYYLAIRISWANDKGGYFAPADLNTTVYDSSKIGSTTTFNIKISKILATTSGYHMDYLTLISLLIVALFSFSLIYNRIRRIRRVRNELIQMQALYPPPKPRNFFKFEADLSHATGVPIGIELFDDETIAHSYLILYPGAIEQLDRGDMLKFHIGTRCTRMSHTDKILAFNYMSYVQPNKWQPNFEIPAKYGSTMINLVTLEVFPLKPSPISFKLESNYKIEKILPRSFFGILYQLKVGHTFVFNLANLDVPNPFIQELTGMRQSTYVKIAETNTSDEWELHLKPSKGVIFGYLCKPADIQKVIQEQADTFLRTRKLPLVLDLDVMHRVRELKDGRKVVLADKVHEFLNWASNLYEISLCSLGDQTYVDMVAQILNQENQIIRGGVAYSARGEYLYLTQNESSTVARRPPKDLNSLFAFYSNRNEETPFVEPLILDDNATMWPLDQQDNIIVIREMVDSKVWNVALYPVVQQVLSFIHESYFKQLDAWNATDPAIRGTPPTSLTFYKEYMRKELSSKIAEATNCRSIKSYPNPWSSQPTIIYMTSNQFQHGKLYKKANLTHSQQMDPFIAQNSGSFDKFDLQPAVNDAVMDYSPGMKRVQPEPLSFNELDLNMEGIRVPYNSPDKPDGALPNIQNQNHTFGCCGFVFNNYEAYVQHATVTHPQYVQMDPSTTFQSAINNSSMPLGYNNEQFSNMVPTEQPREEEMDPINPVQLQYNMQKLQAELDSLIAGDNIPQEQMYRSQSHEFFVNKPQLASTQSQYSNSISTPKTPLSESWQSSHSRLHSRKGSWVESPNLHLSNHSLHNFNTSPFQNQTQPQWSFEQQPQNSWVYEKTRIYANGMNGQLYSLNFEKPYKCTGYPDCNKSYKNSNGLKYHLIHVHGDNPGASTPEFGEFDASQPNSPASFVHPQYRRYQCPFKECDKKYKNLSGLRYHFTHTHSHLTEEEIKNLLREVKERGDAGEGAVIPQNASQSISNQNSIEDFTDLI